MITKTEIWPQLKKSKRYRREFAAQFAKRAIPQQIGLLLKRFRITQTELAKRAGMTQGAISRAVDPDYGNLTINTSLRIASGFDMAFVGAFIPFSELPEWFNRFYSEPFDVPSFDEEDAAPTAATELRQRVTEEEWRQFQEQIADVAAQVSRQREAISRARESLAPRVTVAPPPENVVILDEFKKQSVHAVSEASNLVGQTADIDAEFASALRSVEVLANA